MMKLLREDRDVKETTLETIVLSVTTLTLGLFLKEATVHMVRLTLTEAVKRTTSKHWRPMRTSTAHKRICWAQGVLKALSLNLTQITEHTELTMT
jgi:hypothetical protein